MFMYVCTYAHVCMYVCSCMYVCTYAHVCMYICSCMYVHLLMYVCTYAHVCMYVHMLMYVCTYAHVCMYVYRDCTISMLKTRCTETSKEPIFFLQMTEQSSWVSGWV